MLLVFLGMKFTAGVSNEDKACLIVICNKTNYSILFTKKPEEQKFMICYFQWIIENAELVNIVMLNLIHQVTKYVCCIFGNILCLYKKLFLFLSTKKAVSLL